MPSTKRCCAGLAVKPDAEFASEALLPPGMAPQRELAVSCAVKLPPAPPAQRPAPAQNKPFGGCGVPHLRDWVSESEAGPQLRCSVG